MTALWRALFFEEVTDSIEHFNSFNKSKKILRKFNLTAKSRGVTLSFPVVDSFTWFRVS